MAQRQPRIPMAGDATSPLRPWGRRGWGRWGSFRQRRLGFAASERTVAYDAWNDLIAAGVCSCSPASPGLSAPRGGEESLPRYV